MSKQDVELGKVSATSGTFSGSVTASQFNGQASSAADSAKWGGKSLWVGTATEYAALDTKDANTIYLVTAD